MERMNEKWESLRLNVQEFTPQEYVASCESTKEITLDLMETGCNNGYVQCPSDHQIKDHFEHSAAVTFNPPIESGVDAIKTFWEKAFNLVNNSPEFGVYCDGGVYVGTARVISRGSSGVSTVSLDNIDASWHSGHCDMTPANDGNPNRILVLAQGWQVLQNHSG